MAPQKNSKQDYKQQDVLQAVLVASGFVTDFGPLTLDAPHALLPLVNTPLIDYTLQLLVTSGVQEILVVASAFATEIKSHVDASMFSQSCRISYVISEEISSLGDALREVDKSGLVKNDFLLVTGDVVSNANLKHLVEAHKERKSKDKQMAMTVIFREGVQGEGRGNRSWSPNDEVFIACDAKTQRILHFQRATAGPDLEVPVAVFQESDSVSLRYDLLDPGIAICTPLVPQIFSDDFDYLTRDDFIKGLLVHQEIMGNSLYLATISSSYAARVSDLATFNAVSKDVLGRWTFPLTPDVFPPGKQLKDVSRCRFRRGCVYRSGDVVLQKGARLGTNVIVGSRSQVGADAEINNSVIGAGCNIGANVRLDGVFLFNGVTIGAGSCVTSSILGEDVTTGSEVKVEAGCVLGCKVKVGDKAIVRAKTEATTDADFKDNELQDLGKDGFGYRYQRVDRDDEDDDAQVEQLSKNLWWQLNLEEEEEESEDSEEEEEDEDEEDMEEEDEEAKDLKQFHQEVLDTLQRGHDENISSENIVLEINSLKQAYFIYIAEVQQCVVKCVLEGPIRSLGLKGKPLLVHVKKNGFPLLKNYIKDAEAQKAALTALAELCSSPDEDVGRCTRDALTLFLGLLYNADIIADSDVVFDWFATQDQTVKNCFAPFVKQLQEAEEEESDDEDDEEDD